MAARTPTAILKINGSGAVHPGRLRERENEPEPVDPIGVAPPEHLDENAAACWREIIAVLPAGVAGTCDSQVVEQLAVLMAEFRLKPMYWPIARHGEMRRILNELGMTPASRSKVKVPKHKDNPFADL